MRQLLALGECMLELSHADTALWRLGVAGDTLNTAWYARRLLDTQKWRVAYGTRIGTDQFSQRIADFLTQANLDTTWVQRDPERTAGLYAINLEQGERSFTYWRGQSAAKHFADDPDWLTRAMATADVLYFSGITLAILAPQAQRNLLLSLAHARQSGRTIVFDPNIRPKLWRDREGMCKTIMAAASVSDWVLPSFDDEQTFFGDTDRQACAQRYLAVGASEVIVKNAGSPMWVASAQGGGEVDCGPRLTPVDSTAAGDAFNAAFLATRLHDGNAVAAAHAGHHLAAQVIGAHGALVNVAP